MPETKWHIRVCGPYQKKFLAVIDKEATISSLINEVSAIFRLNYPHDSLATPFSLSSSKGVLDLHTDIEDVLNEGEVVYITKQDKPVTKPTKRETDRGAKVTEASRTRENGNTKQNNKQKVTKQNEATMNDRKQQKSEVAESKEEKENVTSSSGLEEEEAKEHISPGKSKGKTKSSERSNESNQTKKPEQNGKSATHQQQINGDTKKQVQFTNSPAQENNGNKRKDKKEKEHNREKEHKKGRGQEKDEEEEGDAAHGNGNNDNKEDPQQKRKGEQATINKKQALSTTKKEAKIASPPKLKQEASEVSPKKKEKEMPSPTKKEKKELKGAADEESKEKKVTKSTKGSEPEGEENNKIMDSKSINKKGTASRGTPPPKRAKKEEKEAGAKDENTTLKNSIITNATPVKKRVGDTQVQTPVPAKKIKVDNPKSMVTPNKPTTSPFGVRTPNSFSSTFANLSKNPFSLSSFGFNKSFPASPLPSAPLSTATLFPKSNTTTSK